MNCARCGRPVKYATGSRCEDCFLDDTAANHPTVDPNRYRPAHPGNQHRLMPGGLLLPVVRRTFYSKLEF